MGSNTDYFLLFPVTSCCFLLIPITPYYSLSLPIRKKEKKKREKEKRKKERKRRGKGGGGKGGRCRKIMCCCRRGKDGEGDDDGNPGGDEDDNPFAEIGMWEALLDGWLLDSEYAILGLWVASLLLTLGAGVTLSFTTSPSWVGHAIWTSTWFVGSHRLGYIGWVI